MYGNEIRKEIAHLVEKYAEVAFKKSSFEPGVTTIPPSGKLIGKKEGKQLN